MKSYFNFKENNSERGIRSLGLKPQSVYSLLGKLSILLSLGFLICKEWGWLRILSVIRSPINYLLECYGWSLPISHLSV